MRKFLSRYGIMNIPGEQGPTIMQLLVVVLLVGFIALLAGLPAIFTILLWFVVVGFLMWMRWTSEISGGGDEMRWD